MSNIEKIIEQTDKFVQENFENVQITFDSGNMDKRVYIVEKDEEMDGIEQFIEKTFDEKLYSLDDNIDIVWYDTVTMCCECYGQINTNPTSAFWRQDWYDSDYGAVCSSCFDEKGYAEHYIAELVNNPSNANVMLTKGEIESYGFKRVKEDSSGYNFSGNPKRDYDELSEKYDEVLFSIDSSTPFDTNYSVYVRNVS